ncbi:DUF5667 domain-containing protein [uncultured Jatrophihabitans sp.]|uniref:DUF5667 domain-containing protein n=1 Tax=uncultured Jatrophihabitans sp. TaxID=1610747 RepID=UPI0035CB05C1
MDPRYGTMSEHRVSMLGSSLRRIEDPEHSRDPRVRELVDALKAVDYAPAPSPHFRAELRAQLVAVAPRIIAESTPEAEPASTRARTGSARAGAVTARTRRRRFARPLAVAAGVAAAFLLLLGGAVWQSQKSLPGDSLYGLKRTSENVRLAMSSGGTGRGHEYLRLAQTRVDEARALLRRDSPSAAGTGTLAGGLSPHTAKLISSNLTSSDSDVTHGTDLLSTQAVTARSQSPIALITEWAPGQLARLTDLAAALPQGALLNQTKSSWTLTKSALTRARSLAPAVAAGCASTTQTDPLGPVPTCSQSATRSTPVPVPTSSSAPTAGTGTGTARPGGGAASQRSGGTRPSSAAPVAPVAPVAPATSTPTAPPNPLPSTLTVPSLLPSGPVSVGSCGISVGAGPIGIGIGGCPSHS